MTEFIILSRVDMLTLWNDKPVTVYIDKKPYVLCTDEYFEKQKRERRIKLIIDIPEEEYELIVNDEACGLNILTRAIANGIPLNDIKAEMPILSHWQTDDGQDLLMVADALECIDKHTGSE